MAKATIDLELMIRHETSACEFSEPIRLDHAQIVTVIADFAVAKGLA